MWTKTPQAKPKAVQIPIEREYLRVFLIQMTKSGPGLITAIKCTNETVSKSGVIKFWFEFNANLIDNTDRAKTNFIRITHYSSQ